MTVLVRVGTVAASRKVFAFELVKPSSVVVTGSGSETATISALGSVEFSACETITLNDVFSANYDNYVLVMRAILDGSGAAVEAVVMSFPPYAGSTFTEQRLSADGSTVSGARATSQSRFTVGRVDDAGLYSGSMVYLYGPYLAQPTAHRLVDASTASSAAIYDRAGTESSSTQHENLKLFTPDAEIVSGRVAVYGMRG